MEEIAPQQYRGPAPEKTDVAKNTEIKTNDIKTAPPVEEVPSDKGGVQKQIQEIAPIKKIDPEPAPVEKEIAVPFPFKEKKVLIYFKHNSNELPDQSFERLNQIADYLLHNPDASIDIKGFTDSTGSYTYNVSVSGFRANTIKTFLVGKGIDIARIKTFGLGPENPIATNKTEEGRRKNRRVEIEFNK
jgi:outer membrane protein OmpA-like peptidoglycan-associated protein